MIGAGLQVFAQAFGDVLGGAVRDYRVDQLVAAGLAHVGFGEPQPQPVVHVVAQAQIVVDDFASGRAGFVPVGGEHHLVFGRQKHRPADLLASLRRVFGCGQIRVCAGTAFGSQLQHPGPECRQHPTARWQPRCVEFVEVADQRVVRLHVLLGVLGMAHSDAEQKPSGISVFDPLKGLRDGGCRRRPDVDDPGGQLQ